ncbi:hypothetical protein ES708_13771 [subsurface metagenome]
MNMRISQHSTWWYGLICIFGKENVHWEYLETDLDWWAVRFIALNIQN